MNDASDRLSKLVSLKDYVITRGGGITDETIRGIVELEGNQRAKTEKSWTPDELFKLDSLIRAISENTYPITLENVENLLNEKGSYRWVHWFLWTGVGAAVLSGIMMYLLRLQVALGAQLWEVLAAIFLGIVGAVIYVMLPNGKINIVAGLDQETITTNIARIIVGGILGYVIYLIVPDIFAELKSTDRSSARALGLLYPLVGGYSISLVVGVLSKAVTAVELTLGLDDKKNISSLRK